MSTPYIAFVCGTEYASIMVDGAKVRRARIGRAMTIRDLSRASGVNHSAISLIERGKRSPWPRTLKRLADALGVEIRELLKDD